MCWVSSIAACAKFKVLTNCPPPKQTDNSQDPEISIGLISKVSPINCQTLGMLTSSKCC